MTNRAEQYSWDHAEWVAAGGMGVEAYRAKRAKKEAEKKANDEAMMAILVPILAIVLALAGIGVVISEIVKFVNNL